MTVVVWEVDVSTTAPLLDGVSEELLVTREPAGDASLPVSSSSFSILATSAEKRNRQ